MFKLKALLCIAAVFAAVLLHSYLTMFFIGFAVGMLASLALHLLADKS